MKKLGLIALAITLFAAIISVSAATVVAQKGIAASPLEITKSGLTLNGSKLKKIEATEVKLQTFDKTRKLTLTIWPTVHFIDGHAVDTDQAAMLAKYLLQFPELKSWIETSAEGQIGITVYKLDGDPAGVTWKEKVVLLYKEDNGPVNSTSGNSDFNQYGLVADRDTVRVRDKEQVLPRIVVLKTVTITDSTGDHLLATFLVDMNHGKTTYYQVPQSELAKL